MVENGGSLKSEVNGILKRKRLTINHFTVIRLCERLWDSILSYYYNHRKE